MDLHDFEGQAMYFDDAVPQRAEELIQQTADLYGDEKAEVCLLKAFFIAPRNLTVLVAMYRYYYYQHKYEDAINVAQHAMEVSGSKLNLPKDWHDLKLSHLGEAAVISMGQLRFYLMALKGAGYLCLRSGNFETGADMLSKVVELDPKDRLRAAFLLDIALEALNVQSGENVSSIRGFKKNKFKIKGEVMNKEDLLDDDLEELCSAEDFLQYFDIEYEQSVVYVNRLHILQRFHNYISKAEDTMPEDDNEKRNIYKTLLEKAYQDFVTSDAVTEKVFKVFRMHEPQQTFVSLDQLVK